jgi:hypothetical protein
MPRLGQNEAVQSERVRRLGGWWETARGGRDLPDRRAFDPTQWKYLLPYLLLSEVTGPGFRVRYRLVGTAVVYVVGFDFTGRYLDEMLDPGAGEDWIANYRAAHDECRPVYGTATVPKLGGEPFHYSYGIFPLTSGEPGRVAQFVAIEDYGAVQPRVQSTLLDLTIRRAQED